MAIIGDLAGWGLRGVSPFPPPFLHTGPYYKIHTKKYNPYYPIHTRIDILSLKIAKNCSI